MTKGGLSGDNNLPQQKILIPGRLRRQISCNKDKVRHRVEAVDMIDRSFQGVVVSATP